MTAPVPPPVTPPVELGRLCLDIVPGHESDALRRILETVDNACAAAGGGPEWSDVRLAVEEACTNVMEHGYGAAGGPIDLVLRADDREILVAIRDRAAPFPPENSPPPDLTSDWEARAVGGLGWHLIKQVMDRLEYESSATAGNELRLVKRRSRSTPA